MDTATESCTKTVRGPKFFSKNPAGGAGCLLHFDQEGFVGAIAQESRIWDSWLTEDKEGVISQQKKIFDSAKKHGRSTVTLYHVQVHMQAQVATSIRVW